MNEKELEGAKKLIENKDVKKGSYSFIGNSNITYAYIKILLDYIKQLEQENQQLKEQLEASENARKKQSDKINNILDYIDSHRFTEQFENVGNERNVRKNIFHILDIDKGEMKDE